MKVKPIKNNIQFQFVDATLLNGEFAGGTSKGGIHTIKSVDDTARTPRWVKAVAVGSECKHIREGDTFLLPALRWTKPVTVGDERIWKTDESEAVGVQLGDEFKVLNKFVVYAKDDAPDEVSPSGLILVTEAKSDTITGTVRQVGEKATQELTGSVIYYKDALFFEKFELNGEELAFTKEENILAYTPNGD